MKKNLYLISGFLGAGKTTFLKNIFHVFKNHKTAVIVNEFGKEGIDGKVLKKEGIQISEINNGSIFCVCRSDLFIDTLLQAIDHDIDTILVETSGLADPSGMSEILETIKKLKGEVLYYQGNICIVDGKNLKKVIHTAMPVKHQIETATLIVLNKVDLISTEDRKSVIKLIREMNDKATIIKTTYGKIENHHILFNLHNDNIDIKTKNIKKKIIGQQKILITVEGDFSKEKVIKWLQSFASITYRIKGFVKLQDKYYHVNAVNKDISFNKIEDVPEKPVIVVISNGNQPVRKEIVKGWNLLFKNPIIME